MNLPATWSDTPPTSSASSQPYEIGIWLLKVFINIATGIAQVNMPYYNRNSPMQGAKPARESLRKLLTGMNNDQDPLNFRSEFKYNCNVKDPYYPFSPGWTNLAGGNNPTHTCTPLQLCEWLIDAAKCVPFVRDVEITLIETDNTQSVVTIDMLRNRNLLMPPVPYIPGGDSNHPMNAPADITANATANAAAASNTPTGNAATNQANIVQSDMQAKHILDLEKELADLKALMEKKAKEDDTEAELINEPQQDTTPVPERPSRRRRVE